MQHEDVYADQLDLQTMRVHVRRAAPHDRVYVFQILFVDGTSAHSSLTLDTDGTGVIELGAPYDAVQAVIGGSVSRHMI